MIVCRDYKRTVRLDLEHGCAAERQEARALIHNLLHGLSLGKRHNSFSD